MAKGVFYIDYGCLRVLGPYLIGKSPCTTYSLTFEFWSSIVRPYCWSVREEAFVLVYYGYVVGKTMV